MRVDVIWAGHYDARMRKERASFSAARGILPSALAITLSTACGSGSSNGGRWGCQNIDGTASAGSLSIAKPAADALACTATSAPERTICVQKTPDLSCVGKVAKRGAPIAVTFAGCVATFGLEARIPSHLRIALFREKRADAARTDPGYDMAGSPGSQTERSPDARIGELYATASGADACKSGERFEIESVMTETPMIVRVTDQHLAASERAFVDTYRYNVILPNTKIRVAALADAMLVDNAETYCLDHPCFVVDDVNTIVDTMFRTIALTSGAGEPPGSSDLWDGEGAGHIAGEVQDCTSNDKVMNAVVAIDAEVDRLTYFNVGFDARSNLDEPRPDPTRGQTNADGLYAGISVDTERGGREAIRAVATPSVCGNDGICRCENNAPNAAWTAKDSREGETLTLGTQGLRLSDSVTSAFTRRPRARIDCDR